MSWIFLHWPQAHQLDFSRTINDISRIDFDSSVVMSWLIMFALREYTHKLDFSHTINESYLSHRFCIFVGTNDYAWNCRYDFCGCRTRVVKLTTMNDISRIHCIVSVTNKFAFRLRTVADDSEFDTYFCDHWARNKFRIWPPRGGAPRPEWILVCVQTLVDNVSIVND